MNTERGGRFLVAAAAAISALGIARSAPAELPRVHLLATGGTISGGQQPLDAAGLKALVPGLSQVATVTLEDIARIGSSRMTPEVQFRLASRINELFAGDSALAGIVVSHGD
jgi:L-asparaginase